MKEARYYFGCCTLNNQHIFVFGGMNDSFMLNELSYEQSKCLNSIERYSIVRNEWDTIELSTYQKFPYCSHIVAVNLPWDTDHILIVGGQTYNKETSKFENMRMVYKFYPYEDKLQECKKTAIDDRFLMGMGITDGKQQVATLGEKVIHFFNGTSWKTVPKDFDAKK